MGGKVVFEQGVRKFLQLGPRRYVGVQKFTPSEACRRSRPNVSAKT